MIRSRGLCQPRTLRLITSHDQSAKFSRHLLKTADLIGVDCEGVRLGRFGRLSLMQVMEANGDTTLLDANVEGVIEGMRPVLVSKKVSKIMHDCREDSAALFHQYKGIRLGGVFDTQVVSLLIQKHESSSQLRQEGYMDLAQRVLQCDREDDTDSSNKMKEKMIEDPLLWMRRPLTKDHIRYAIHGVKFLIPLWMNLIERVDIDQVREASDAWVEYCHLNTELAKPEMIEKIGF